VHISSGLSGTLESAQQGAKQVPEADVAHVDTLTLSGDSATRCMAAALGARAGWTVEAILERLRKIREGPR
jgi:fatty acid-binding protein DegV